MGNEREVECQSPHQWLSVVGVGDDGIKSLFPDALRCLGNADVVLGSERQLAWLTDVGAERRVLKFKGLVDELQTLHDKQVVVLASGDPLCFGIGSYLTTRFGRDRVGIYPNVSSIQWAFSRLGIAWQDARIISVHGRPIAGLAQRVDGASKVALLTDDINTPAAIARYLLQYGMREYTAFVGENLGGPEERTGHYRLEELADTDCAPLNVVVLLRDPTERPKTWTLGIPDEEFSQRRPDRGLITKREIRVLTVAELALKPGQVLWDIGACTGSVTIEAMRQTPGVTAYAIEKNESDLENLVENQHKFRTDFVAIHGKAPDKLNTFPDPDAVFVGGSGGELEELLAVCVRRLHPGGRVVVNAATLETLSTTQKTLQRLGVDVTVQLVQTARSKPILHLTRLEGMNPVFLVTGLKPDGEAAQ